MASLTKSENVVSDGAVVTAISTYTVSGNAFVKPAYTSYDIRSASLIKATTAVTPVADWSCGVKAVRQGDRSILLDGIITEKPAQGIESARDSLFLRAIDARTMAVLWTIPIVQDRVVTQFGPLCGPGSVAPRVGNIVTTADGSYALWAAQSRWRSAPGGHGVALLIDLSSGQAREMTDAVTIIGNWVVVEKRGADARLVDPKTSATLGTLAGSKEYFGSYSDLGQTAVGSGEVVVKTLGGLHAMALPSGVSKWTIKHRLNGISIAYEAKADVFVLREVEYGQQDVMAISPKDGHTLWGPIHTEEPCGTASGKVMVSVNGQLAVLDAATGRQLSYDPARRKCPQILPGIAIHNDTPATQTIVVF